MRRVLLAAVAAQLIAAPLFAQTVYRCVRPDGSVYLGQERPAPGACVEQSTTQWEPAALPAPPPAAGKAGPAATAPADRHSLWERREGAGPWREILPFDAQPLCQAELERRTRSAQARLLNAFIDEPGTVKLRAEGGREYVSYRCLPAGMRPS